MVSLVGTKAVFNKTVQSGEKEIQSEIKANRI